MFVCYFYHSFCQKNDVTSIIITVTAHSRPSLSVLWSALQSLIRSLWQSCDSPCISAAIESIQPACSSVPKMLVCFWMPAILTVLLSLFSYSWKDISDHTFYVWQLRQHISGRKLYSAIILSTAPVHFPLLQTHSTESMDCHSKYSPQKVFFSGFSRFTNKRKWCKHNGSFDQTYFYAHMIHHMAGNVYVKAYKDILCRKGR